MSEVGAESDAREILEALRRDLTPWCSEHGVRCIVAEGPAAAVELLSAGAPAGALLVLWYGGDSPVADAGLVCDNQVAGRFAATLCTARALTVSDAGAAPDALALAEALRTEVHKNATGAGLLDGWRYGGLAPATSYGGELLPAWTLTLEGCFAFRTSNEDE